jgi:hypothetical protein
MENKSQGDVGQTASIYLATHVKLELCSPTSLWGTTNRMVCLQPSRASHVPWVQWIPEFVVRPLRTRCACHRFKIGLHYDYHLICHLLLAIVSHCFFCWTSTMATAKISGNLPCSYWRVWPHHSQPWIP